MLNEHDSNWCTGSAFSCWDSSNSLSHCPLFPPQRFPTDRAYFIAKELLTTERTYVKDLEVLTVVRTSEPARQHAAPLFVFPVAVLWGENIDYSG